MPIIVQQQQQQQQRRARNVSDAGNSIHAFGVETMRAEHLRCPPHKSFDQTEIGYIKTISRTLQFGAVLFSGTGRTHSGDALQCKHNCQVENHISKEIMTGLTTHRLPATHCWPNGFGLRWIIVMNYDYDFGLYEANIHVSSECGSLLFAKIDIRIWHTKSREIPFQCVFESQMNGWMKLRQRKKNNNSFLFEPISGHLGMLINRNSCKWQAKRYKSTSTNRVTRLTPWLMGRDAFTVRDALTTKLIMIFGAAFVLIYACPCLAPVNVSPKNEPNGNEAISVVLKLMSQLQWDRGKTRGRDIYILEFLFHFSTNWVAILHRIAQDNEHIQIIIFSVEWTSHENRRRVTLFTVHLHVKTNDVRSTYSRRIE